MGGRKDIETYACLGTQKVWKDTQETSNSEDFWERELRDQV